MENIIIKAEKRNEREIKSKALKRLRKDGFIPAVIYGLKKEPVSVKVKEKELKDLLKGKNIYSTIFDMQMEDDGKKVEKEAVLVKDFQIDPITGKFLHLDFLRIEMKREIETTVPVHIINEEISIGVKEKGGVLQHGLRELRVSCLPGDIPDHVEYDIKELDMGSTVRVSDIYVSDNVKILNDPEEVVVSIIHPTLLREEEVAPEEEAEKVAAEPEVIGKGKEEPGGEKEHSE